MRGMTYLYVWHDTILWATCLARDLWMCMTWLAVIRINAIPYVWHALFLCVTCLISMCETPHFYVWDTTRLYVQHGSFLFATWHISMGDMPRSWFVCMCDVTSGDSNQSTCIRVTWPVSMCDAWLIRMCDMAHSYLRHDAFLWATCLARDSFVCLTWLGAIQIKAPAFVWRDSFLYVTKDSSLCATWLICICDMPHFYGRHASFVTRSCVCDVSRGGSTQSTRICVTQLIFLCDSHNDSFLCATWLICFYDMMHFYGRHASFVTRLCVWETIIFLCHSHNDSFLCAKWLIWIYDMMHFYGRHASFVTRLCVWEIIFFFVWQS